MRRAGQNPTDVEVQDLINKIARDAAAGAVGCPVGVQVGHVLTLNIMGFVVLRLLVNTTRRRWSFMLWN